MKMLEIIEADTQAFSQNEKLLNALHEARDEIAALRAEVDKLCAPPSTYGVYLSAHDDDTVDVLAQGRKGESQAASRRRRRVVTAGAGAGPERSAQRRCRRGIRDPGRRRSR